MSKDNNRLITCERCTVAPDCMILGSLALLLPRDDVTRLNAEGCGREGQARQGACIVDRAQVLLAIPTDTEVQ